MVVLAGVFAPSREWCRRRLRQNPLEYQCRKRWHGRRRWRAEPIERRTPATRAPPSSPLSYTLHPCYPHPRFLPIVRPLARQRPRARRPQISSHAARAKVAKFRAIPSASPRRRVKQNVHLPHQNVEISGKYAKLSVIPPTPDAPAPQSCGPRSRADAFARQPAARPAPRPARTPCAAVTSAPSSGLTRLATRGRSPAASRL